MRTRLNKAIFEGLVYGRSECPRNFRNRLDRSDVGRWNGHYYIKVAEPGLEIRNNRIHNVGQNLLVATEF